MIETSSTGCLVRVLNRFGVFSSRWYEEEAPPRAVVSQERMAKVFPFRKIRCKCKRIGLKRCYSFKAYRKKSMKCSSESYIASNLREQSDELGYMASGVFACRMNTNDSVPPTNEISSSALTDNKNSLVPPLHEFAEGLLSALLRTGCNATLANFAGMKESANPAVLMILESRDGKYCYNFPGGKRDSCVEASLTCALREFDEETRDLDGCLAPAMHAMLQDPAARHNFGQDELVFFAAHAKYALYAYHVPSHLILPPQSDDTKGSDLPPFQWVPLRQLELVMRETALRIEAETLAKVNMASNVTLKPQQHASANDELPRKRRGVKRKRSKVMD